MCARTASGARLRGTFRAGSCRRSRRGPRAARLRGGLPAHPSADGEPRNARAPRDLRLAETLAREPEDTLHLFLRSHPRRCDEHRRAVFRLAQSWCNFRSLDARAPTIRAARPGGGTGRHCGLKSRCSKGRAGSNPAPGTQPASDRAGRGSACVRRMLRACSKSSPSSPPSACSAWSSSASPGTSRRRRRPVDRRRRDHGRPGRRDPVRLPRLAVDRRRRHASPATAYAAEPATARSAGDRRSRSRGVPDRPRAGPRPAARGDARARRRATTSRSSSHVTGGLLEVLAAATGASARSRSAPRSASRRCTSRAAARTSRRSRSTPSATRRRREYLTSDGRAERVDLRLQDADRGAGRARARQLRPRFHRRPEGRLRAPTSTRSSGCCGRAGCCSPTTSSWAGARRPARRRTSGARRASPPSASSTTA